MTQPLEPCSLCGDKVPGGEHDCWARKKMQESVRMPCRYCGTLTINGVCLKMGCYDV